MDLLLAGLSNGEKKQELFFLLFNCTVKMVKRGSQKLCDASHFIILYSNNNDSSYFIRQHYTLP